MSRHRPLRMVTEVSSLAIFEAQPRAAVTTVV
uniref:Transcriptional regulator n=1 Tax=Heterorhabditis bacteriophora TaxID=37862 RepID=A0A1I7W765_HETBA